MERVMKQKVLALVLLAAAIAGPSAAYADYALVQYRDGYCQIWWDSAGIPWGDSWTKVAIGLPDHITAEAALNAAIAQQTCR